MVPTIEDRAMLIIDILLLSPLFLVDYALDDGARLERGLQIKVGSRARVILPCRL